MWFELESADLGFLAVAPCRFDTVTTIDASPERVFQAFVEPGQLGEFIFGFRRCSWLTAAPYGVGSTRQLELYGLSFREHFLAWLPGRRFCFAIDATSLPLMVKMIEDVQIDALDSGKTRVVWSVYYEPNLLTRLVHPFARYGFELGYRQSVDRLERHLMRTRTPATPEPVAPSKARRGMGVS